MADQETPPQEPETDFGFASIPAHLKAEKVRQVFEQVASRYDCMNDLMSGGLHRIWKRTLIQRAQIRAHHRVLDIASGTGDLIPLVAERVRTDIPIWMLEINAPMLQKGYTRLIDQGLLHRLRCTQADAEALPFPDQSFDRITLAFGLRNMTNKPQALREAFRVLAPGGALYILEFSKPYPWLAPIYDRYSFQLIPKLGAWITGQAEPYQYLVESIRKHPDQTTLQGMLEDAGFERARYENLTHGIVAIHSGYRL